VTKSPSYCLRGTGSSSALLDDEPPMEVAGGRTLKSPFLRVVVFDGHWPGSVNHEVPAPYDVRSRDADRKDRRFDWMGKAARPG